LATSLELLVPGPNGAQRVVVDRSPFTIGRKSENDLQIAPTDVQVSRRHAELIQDGDVWHVRDCSRSGTYVNGTRDLSQLLHPGDRLRLGPVELTVSGHDADTTAESAIFDFRQLNTLLKSLRGLGSSHVLDEVLALVLDSALELTGAERGVILLADAHGHLSSRLARAQGNITLATAQTSVRIPEEVFAVGEDRAVDLRLERAAADHAQTIQSGIRYVLCTPLNAVQFGTNQERRRIGVLYLDSRTAAFRQHTEALHVLAAEAAIVIENARLYREVLEKEREAEELRVAASIQQSLLPPPTHDSPLAHLVAASTPCRDVGGDLFEYADHRNGGLLFAVADVAGKGTSAALLTAVVQGLLASEADSSDAPDAVLTRINKALCRRTIEGRFVTAFYGHVTQQRRLLYCNAGHNPPLLVSGGQVQRLPATGCPLGLFDTLPYEAGEVPVQAGDVLLVYSDGVSEAVNPEGEEFGEERLAACLTSAPYESAAQVLGAVQDAVRQFAAGADVIDDVTVMVLRFR
jgi:serine phosphatase RsbU (regulator of sigma subunit)/pSer/pThr/pTyr-binding forkhead associated (FHA) protein